MKRVVYYQGEEIEYTLLVKNIKNIYFTVDREKGVLLKGPITSKKMADELILKKASWILRKLEEINAIPVVEVNEDTEVLFLGKKYPIQVRLIQTAHIKIELREDCLFMAHHPKHSQKQIKDALHKFLRNQTKVHVIPRVQFWAKQMRHSYDELRFRKLKRAWGKCTHKYQVMGNKKTLEKIVITLNTECIRLPAHLIDYLIVHELAHIKEQNHSPAFWQEVRKYLPNGKALDNELDKFRF